MGKYDKLTAGIIGCGRMGVRTPDRVRQSVPEGWLPLSHAEAIKSINDLELVALCDKDPERVSWAAEAYKVSKTYDDFKSLICETKPDIVSIATRTEKRCEIIKFAAENGVKAIHTEKPISRNISDCRKALKAVVDNNVKFSYGTYRRYMDIYRKAKDLIKTGEIGQLLEICIEHGKTMLLWNHPHSIDLLLFFSDCLDVDFVQAYCDIKASKSNALFLDDDPILEFAFVKFKNGVNGIVTSASGLNIRLSGTDGTLNIVGDGSWLEIRKKTSNQTPYHLKVDKLIVESELSGTQRAFSELISAVRGDNNKLSITTETVCAGQRILLSIAQSSILGGQKIDPLQLDESFTVTGKFGEYYA
ncbi:MAG: Gfo/Idh/MocA family oxidoreductase [Desulfobacterales bacterium]|jgi:predicted dehydrogenase